MNNCKPFNELFECEIVDELVHPVMPERLIGDGKNDPTRFPKGSSEYSKKPLNCEGPEI